MTRIDVLRPDAGPLEHAPLELAPRRELPERPVVGVVVNGKPFAAELLHALVDELTARLRRPVDVESVAKPSPIFVLGADEATALAARCHVVVTGVGD